VESLKYIQRYRLPSQSSVRLLELSFGLQAVFPLFNTLATWAVHLIVIHRFADLRVCNLCFASNSRACLQPLLKRFLEQNPRLELLCPCIVRMLSHAYVGLQSLIMEIFVYSILSNSRSHSSLTKISRTKGAVGRKFDEPQKWLDCSVGFVDKIIDD
jgi:hypothetical protein